MISFSPREIASLIWAPAIGTWAIKSNPRVLDSLKQLLISSKNKRIIISLFLILTYTLAEVLLLKSLGLWGISYIKETFYWVIGAAVIFLNTIADEHRSFSNKLKNIFRWAIILEFLVGLYSFSLAVELILVPFLVIITGIAALKNVSDQRKVQRFADFILGVFGFILLAYSLYRLSKDSELWTLTGLLEILSPILLTIMFIPFLYLFSLFAAYEMLFLRLDRGIKDPQLLRAVRVKVLKRFHFRLGSLNDWWKNKGMEIVHNPDALKIFLAKN